MRKKYGKDLTDAQLDELLAERFREFQLGAAQTIDFEATSLFKRAWNFIKTLAKLKDFALARLYYAINTGAFNNIKPSQENINRFKELYGDQGALFTFRGNEFKEIPNQKALNDSIDSMIYLLFNMPIEITDENGNKRVTVMQIREYTDINSLPFDKLYTIIKNSKNPALQEMAEHIGLIDQLLRDKLKKYQIKSINKFRDNNEEEGSDVTEDVSNLGIDDYTKASYEQDPFGNAPAEVKFFFTTIPAYQASSEGNKWISQRDPITGWPKFRNPNEVWNTVINDLHSVKTVKQLEDLVNEKAQTRALYVGIKSNLDRLLARSRQSDKNIATQAEATLTKILTTVHSARNNFDTIKASTVQNNEHHIDIVDNTVENKSRAYPAMWSQSLFLTDGVFTIDDNGDVQYTKTQTTDGKRILQSAVKRYDSLYEGFRNDGRLVINGQKYDIHEPFVQQRVKSSIVNMLASVGIDIDAGTLDFILDKPEYSGDGSTYSKLQNFVTSTANFGGLKSIFNRLSILLQQDDLNTITVNNKEEETSTVNTTDIYTNMGFVKTLANAVIKYHSTTDSLMSIGAGNNLLYGSSQNNFVTDRVDELNEDGEIIDKFLNVPYTRSSYILDRIRNNGDKLKVNTFVNFKTSNFGDTGSDYHGITDLEDYIAKMSLVLNDRLIFPTVADKKTYPSLSGITLPHERLQGYNSNRFYSRYVTFGDNYVEQLLKYAYSELEAVEQALAQLDPNSEQFIPEEQRTKNYHTPMKYKDASGTHKVEPNGTRFRYLIGVYTIDQNGEIQFNSFNDPSKTSRQNLQEAKRLFFNLPREQ
mgnify:CR=1 FL=1